MEESDPPFLTDEDRLHGTTTEVLRPMHEVAFKAAVVSETKKDKIGVEIEIEVDEDVEVILVLIAEFPKS